jgi:Ca2+-binding EF-hand superfamily protein
MRRTTFLAAAVTALATHVSAQSAALTQGDLAALDGDGDGAVTRAEFDTFAATAFEMMDADDSGTLSGAELDPHITSESFDELDADGDGMVSRSEFGQRMSADFAAADRDGNDIID